MSTKFMTKIKNYTINLEKSVLLKNVLGFLLCLSLLYLPYGCQGDKKQIVARIGDQTITLDEFNLEFNKVRLEYLSFNIKDKKSLNKLKSSFLNRLIERKLLLTEAQKLGIEVTEDELNTELSHIKKDYTENSFQETLINEYTDYEDWEERIRMKLLIEKLVNKVILSKISIEDEEVEDYYRTYSDEFLVPKQVRARQIVVSTEIEARKILKRLKAGEDFKKLAKEKSLSPDGEQGGDLGYFSRGRMPPEFDKIVFSLPKGRLSTIVKTPYGFHIFKVEGKRKARKLFLTEANEQIEKKLRQKKAEEEYDKWLKKIRNKAIIEMNAKLLEEINK